MATATRSVQINEEIITPRMKNVRACINQYFKWRDTDDCPTEDLPKLVAKLLHAKVVDLSDVTPDHLALIYWDKTENGSSLLDYDTEINYIRGLVKQASLLLGAYMRQAVTRGGITHAVVCRKPLDDGSPWTLMRLSSANIDERAEIIRILEVSAFAKVQRAKELGNDWSTVHKALKRLEARAEALYVAGNA
jgi:hypothetical protein